MINPIQPRFATFTSKSTDTYYIDVGSYFDAYLELHAQSIRSQRSGPQFQQHRWLWPYQQRAFEQLLNLTRPRRSPRRQSLGVDNVDVPEV